MHEFTILHLFVNFDVKPLIFEYFRNVFKSNTRQCERILYPSGILRRLEPILNHVKENFSQFRSKMSIQVLGFSQLIVCTSIHHNFSFAAFFWAVLRIFPSVIIHMNIF